MDVKALDPESAPHPRPDRALFALWAGVLGPPLVWLVHLEANYLMVPLACRHDNMLIVHGITVAAIVATALTGLVALQSWRRAGGEWPDSSGSAVTQERFLASVGLLLMALVVVALAAQWLPSFFLDPCR
jgi:hypothetical protein